MDVLTKKDIKTAFDLMDRQDNIKKLIIDSYSYIKRPYNKILYKGFKSIESGKVYIAKNGRGIKGICLEIYTEHENNYFLVSYYKLRKYYREI